MLPSDAFVYFKSKIEKISLISFCTAFFFGILIHFFRLTNTLLNWDATFNFHDPQNTIYLGRWFLTIACGISSYYDLQWVNGILSILYLSMASVLVIKLLKIGSIIPAVLVSLLFVSFPTVASTFSYMYTADGYFLGLLLMLLGLYLTDSFPNGWISGSVLLCFGLGCYQAYLGFIITLILIMALQQLLFQDFEPRLFFIKYGKMILFGGIGTFLYMLINKLLLNLEGNVLSSYNGISEMGFSFSNIISGVKSSYIDFVYFFFGPLRNIALYQILNLCLFIFIGLLVIVNLINLFKEKTSYKFLVTFLTIICFILLPIACGIVYFISPQVRYYMLMNECYLSIYLIPILFWDIISKRSFAIRWSCLVLSILIIFNFSIVSNIAYIKLEASNQATYFMLNRLVDRIEQLPEYANIKYICVLGHIPGYDIIESNLPPNISGVRDTYFIDNEKHFSAILRDRFGLNLETHTTEDHKILESDSKVSSMAIWPSTDSILVLNDTVVVKMGE